MSGVVTHKSPSAKPDTPDTSLIGSGKWGEEHVFAGGAANKLLQWDAGQSDKVSWTDTPTLVNLTLSGKISLADGSVSAPSLVWTRDTTSGLYSTVNGTFAVTAAGTERLRFGSQSGGAHLTVSGSGTDLGAINIAANGGGGAMTTPDLQLWRDAAATLQLGKDAASPVAQTLKAHDGSGTNIAGADLTLAGGNGTGSGLGGALIFNTTPAAGSGSSQNASTERARFTSPGHFIQAELTTNPGTGDLAADAAVAIYNKADKLVFAYNNGGVMTYISIPLDGSTTTWTHSTSAP